MNSKYEITRKIEEELFPGVKLARDWFEKMIEKDLPPPKPLIEKS